MDEGEIKIRHHYDQIADVLYIDFIDDGEPTYSENIDDILFFEVGWFSKEPKGIRVMSPKKNEVEIIIKVAKKHLKQAVLNRCKELKCEEAIFGDALRQNLPAMVSNAM